MTSKHAEQLEASGISAKVAETRGYRSVDNPSELPSIFKNGQRRTGLLVPMYWGGERVLYQLRPDDPRTARKGTVVKYETPKGEGIRLDCHPAMQDKLSDPTVPLLVTEGVKKADAAATLGVPCVALIGVSCWAGNAEADWDDVALDGREVYVVFDSDVTTKPEVRRELTKLSRFLGERGATVQVVYLPDRKDGAKVGLDDYLADGHDIANMLALAEDPPSDLPADAPVPPGYDVPSPWAVDEAGTYRTKMQEGIPVPELVAHAPVLVTGRLTEPDGREAMRLAWRRDGTWRQTEVRREEALNTQKLQALASEGFPVNSVNARSLTAYLADLEAANLDRLPVTRATSRLGWYGDGPDDFVATATGQVTYLGPPGLASRLAPFGSSGTTEGWRDAVTPLRDHPRVALGVLAALSAPLLRVIEGQPFVIDWSGETSTGKTTTLLAAASVWGAPRLVASWDATLVALEEMAGALDGLPLLLDETKRAAKPEDVGKLIYNVSQGQGRARGARGGGLRETAEWSTVLLSTGEQPITTFTNDGGTRGRVVSVWGHPFETTDRELVLRLTSDLGEHYGHAGPAFVAELLARRDEWPRWRQRFEETATDLASLAGTTVEERRARYVAVLRMAARLAESFGVLDWSPDESFWRSLVVSGAGAEDDDRPLAALKVAWDWALGHPDHFWRNELGRIPPSRGWAGRWDAPDENISFIPQVLRRVLDTEDFDLNEVVRVWADRGWLSTGRAENQKVVKVDGKATRCVVLRYSALRAALDLAEGEEERLLNLVEEEAS